MSASRRESRKRKVDALTLLADSQPLEFQVCDPRQALPHPLLPLFYRLMTFPPKPVYAKPQLTERHKQRIDRYIAGERQKQLSQQHYFKSRPQLSESLTVNLMECLSQAAKRVFDPTSPIVIDAGCENYSQTPLIKNINAYLKARNLPLIDDAGHCHGLGACWLLMVDWGLRAEFIKMKNVIVACSADQLTKIAELIEIMLKLIELGQNPEDYSQASCYQQHLHLLFGVPRRAISFTGNYNKESLKCELAKRLKETNGLMVMIRGFEMDKESKEEIGHSIAVNVGPRKKYLFYDSNKKSAQDQELASLDDVIDETWDSIFNEEYDGSPREFHVDAVKSLPKPAWLKMLLEYFQRNNNLVESIVGAPIRSEEKPKEIFPEYEDEDILLMSRPFIFR